MKSLRDKRGTTRSRAAEELGKLKDPRTLDPLLHVLTHDLDPNVRANAAAALGELGDKRAVEHLIERLKDQNEELMVREFAALALGVLGDERAFQALKGTLSAALLLPGRSLLSVHVAAARALMKLDPDALLALLTTIVDHRQGRNLNALEVLRHLEDARAVDLLLRGLLLQLSSESPEERARALEVLRHLEDPRAVDLRHRGLLRQLSSESPEERARAARALGELRRPEDIAPLSRLLDDPYSVTKREWDIGMPESWAAEAVFAPPGVWRDRTSYPVREATLRALEQIGGPEASRILEEYRARPP